MEKTIAGDLPGLKAALTTAADQYGLSKGELFCALMDLGSMTADPSRLFTHFVPNGVPYLTHLKSTVAMLERADDANAEAPDLVLVRGDKVKLTPVSWLWHGYLPLGMMSVLGGAPGAGKTTIALYVAAIVTTGERWPDGTPCRWPGNALIWSGEDHQSVLAARLKAAGADLSKVFFIEGVSGPNGGPFDPAHDWPLLRERALELKPRLIVVDPIVSAVARDGNKSNDVRRGLQPLVDLAEDLNCAVLGITHLKKSSHGQDAPERITGSIAYVALARVVLMAAKARVEEGETPYRVLVRSKSNIGPDDGGFKYELARVEVLPCIEGQTIQWGDPIQGDARTILNDAEGDAQGNRRRDVDGPPEGPAEAFLRTVLAGGALPAKTVEAEAKAAGVPWSAVRRAKDRLGVLSQKSAMCEGWHWVPPWPAAEDVADSPSFTSATSSASSSTFNTFAESDKPASEGKAADELTSNEEGATPINPLAEDA